MAQGIERSDLSLTDICLCLTTGIDICDLSTDLMSH